MLEAHSQDIHSSRDLDALPWYLRRGEEEVMYWYSFFYSYQLGTAKG